MLRIVGLILILAYQAPGVWPASADQAEMGSETSSNHLEQLQKCREGLVDPKARPEDRKRWAELLFSYQSQPAQALVVELLSDAQMPDVQRALCGVLADRARSKPQGLSDALVEPLMDLLGAESEELVSMAAGALADFPGSTVPAKLGALASRTDVPLGKRLAAINALAPNTHRREVTGQLISLLDAGVPEITERVAAELEAVTPQDFGSDLELWRRWWEQESGLTEEAWLAEQLQIHRDRSRRLSDEFVQYRKVTRRNQQAATARLRGFQRELYRVLNSEQQEAKLVEWLGDPVPVVKLTAFSIIKARIADEGKRPEGSVLSALLKAFREGSALVRREALDIIQNLNDPAVVEAVLTELRRETDPPTRHAMFKAIGKLDRPEAIPALIREIASATSFPECVREAAISLGSVAGAAGGDERLTAAAAPLKERFHAVSADDPTMRAALLTAMAGIADPAFTLEFLEAIESDEAMVVQPAVRGLLAVGEDSKLPRLRTLMAHADALVRLAATEAVGQLGHEDADLERLLTRLDPAIETNKLARDAAWRGFRGFLSRRSVSDRIKAAERLRDQPDLEVEYLEELADSLSGVNGASAGREAVLDRLAALLVADDHHAEAVPHLRTLCDLRSVGADGAAMECGLRLLDATLRDPAASGLADLIRELAGKVQANNGAVRDKIVECVAAWLESGEMALNVENARRQLAQLRSVPTDVLGEEWEKLLERAAARLESDDEDVPAPTPQSPGE